MLMNDRIRLPVQQQYYPRIEALRWHRENVFQLGIADVPVGS